MKGYKQRVFFTFLIVSSIMLPGCSLVYNEIHSPPKTILVESREVLAEGRWKRVSQKMAEGIIPKINTVSLCFSKNTMTCVERRAVVATRDDSKILPYPCLWIYVEIHRIIEWSDTVIKAESHPRAGDVEIRLSIPDKFLEMTYRETEARGAIGADPSSVAHWVLE